MLTFLAPPPTPPHPHFACQTSTNHHKRLHLTVHRRSEQLDGLTAGRECVGGVSGPAWFRSGHAVVR